MSRRVEANYLIMFLRMVLAGALCAAAAAAADEFPQASISNGRIEARLYLPDAARGYYRATRFDWSGVIYSLRYAGHEYFGQWFPRYDPKIHDAITGPVEEFLPEGGLGYDEAAAGGTFIRIGVGLLRKPQEQNYGRFRTYEIVDPGKWTVRRKRDRVEFVHKIASSSGYAYVYGKTVRLVKNEPRMVLEHTLKNTGRRPIEFDVYDHNFVMIDHRPIGPGVTIKFPFDARPATPFKDNAKLADGELVYTRELRPRESVFSELTGYGPTPADYDFRIENRQSRAGVRIRGDKPVSHLVFWSIDKVACPEPYVRLRVEPGGTAGWKISYDFYTMPAPESTKQ